MNLAIQTEKIKEIAKNLGWSLTIKQNEFKFKKSKNKNFTFAVKAAMLTELVDELACYYVNFDRTKELKALINSKNNNIPHRVHTFGIEDNLYEIIRQCEKDVHELFVDISSFKDKEEAMSNV